MNFFKKWFKGTKDFAKSPIGLIQTQLIITIFIVIGLFAGAFQMLLIGFNAVGYILFAFGCLQLVTLYQLDKQYRQLRKNTRLLKKFKEE